MQLWRSHLRPSYRSLPLPYSSYHKQSCWVFRRPLECDPSPWKMYLCCHYQGILNSLSFSNVSVVILYLIKFTVTINKWHMIPIEYIYLINIISTPGVFLYSYKRISLISDFIMWFYKQHLVIWFIICQWNLIIMNCNILMQVQVRVKEVLFLHPNTFFYIISV